MADRHFTRWVMENYGVEKSTAYNYTSAVRRVVSSIQNGGSFDQAFLERLFRQIKADNRNSYYTARAAWKKYRIYAKEVKGVDLPSPDPEMVDLPGAPELPTGVIEAIIYLTSRGGEDGQHGFDLPIGDIFIMKWSDVQPPFQSEWCNTFRPSAGVHGKVSRRWMEILKDYAQHEYGEDKPLVPVKPGSETPYPSKGLRKILAQYKFARG